MNTDRNYCDYAMEETLGIITEEVDFSGDSFGWGGFIPTPLSTELNKRGIIHMDDMFGTWSKDPEHTENPDDIPLLIHKAMDEYRGGRTGPFSDEELDALGSSLFKLGNKKLGEDTIVFNMTSGHDCPSRDHCDCKDHCYAVADEKLWKTPLAYRRRQTVFWDTLNAKEFVDRMPIPRFFRFSEAGDFRTQKDVDKMAEIALLLRLEHGIWTYGYTNQAQFDFSELEQNATVNGHGFLVSNRVVIKAKPKTTDDICPGNCRYCDWCKESTGRTIVFPERKR